jgi:hypothetical protein
VVFDLIVDDLAKARFINGLTIVFRGRRDIGEHARPEGQVIVHETFHGGLARMPAQRHPASNRRGHQWGVSPRSAAACSISRNDAVTTAAVEQQARPIRLKLPLPAA